MLLAENKKLIKMRKKWNDKKIAKDIWTNKK